MPILWIGVPVFVVLASWAGWWIPLNNDISWQYWIARQMRGGTTFGRDIVEVNPPLWFWEAVPLSALSDRLRIDAGHLVVVSVMLRAAMALVLTARLFADDVPRRVTILLAGLALLICLLPLHDFAEREHLMLIGALPYATLIARRRERRPISLALASCIGLFAACGFALKPHFALVPLALELWLAFGLRRSWRPLRVETAVLALVAILYGGAILLFAPDYLSLMLPLVRAAYGAFSPPISWLLFEFWMPTWLLAGLALVCARRHVPIEGEAAIVTATALAIAYFVQGKGFPYHAIPVTATLGWALWLTLVRDATIRDTMIRHPLAVLALALLAITGYELGSFAPQRAGNASSELERLPPGSTVAIISAHSWLAFPLVEDHHFIWPLRTMSLWTIPEIARHGEGAHASPIGLSVRRRTLDMLADDLWCRPPDAILVDAPSRSPALAGTHFSYERFVRSDPRIALILTHYRPSISDDGATVYVLRDRVVAHASHCRPISIRPDFA